VFTLSFLEGSLDLRRELNADGRLLFASAPVREELMNGLALLTLCQTQLTEFLDGWTATLSHGLHDWFSSFRKHGCVEHGEEVALKHLFLLLHILFTLVNILGFQASGSLAGQWRSHVVIIGIASKKSSLVLQKRLSGRYFARWVAGDEYEPYWYAPRAFL
jgi:hypothetical protein